MASTSTPNMAINIASSSSTTEEIPETMSIMSDLSFASSEASIASYKTEKTVNSRKSRYNVLPRRKYADIAPPLGRASLDADVSKTRKQLRTELRPKVATLVEYMYGFKSSQAQASVIHNARRAQELLREMNFIYPEPQNGGDPYYHPIIQRAIDTTWFRNKDDIGVVYHEHFSSMPISIIAVTLTVIECCIDEWSGGTQRDSSWDDAKFETVYESHLSRLIVFKARSPAKFNRLQCDLLQNAREHSGVVESSDLLMSTDSDDAVIADSENQNVLKARMLSNVVSWFDIRRRRRLARPSPSMTDLESEMGLPVPYPLTIDSPRLYDPSDPSTFLQPPPYRPMYTTIQSNRYYGGPTNDLQPDGQVFYGLPEV